MDAIDSFIGVGRLGESAINYGVNPNAALLRSDLVVTPLYNRLKLSLEDCAKPVTNVCVARGATSDTLFTMAVVDSTDMYLLDVPLDDSLLTTLVSLDLSLTDRITCTTLIDPITIRGTAWDRHAEDAELYILTACADGTLVYSVVGTMLAHGERSWMSRNTRVFQHSTAEDVGYRINCLTAISRYTPDDVREVIIIGGCNDGRVRTWRGVEVADPDLSGTEVAAELTWSSFTTTHKLVMDITGAVGRHEIKVGPGDGNTDGY